MDVGPESHLLVVSEDGRFGRCPALTRRRDEPTDDLAATNPTRDEPTRDEPTAIDDRLRIKEPIKL
jgi:hypothetical protein